MKKALAVIILGLLLSSNAYAEEIDFTGSVWKILDLYDGEIKEWEFHEDGKCAYTKIKAKSNQGKYFDVYNANCRWHQNNNKIRWDTNNNYSVRNAKVSNKLIMEGTYTTKNHKGSVFKFKGELISSLKEILPAPDDKKIQAEEEYKP